MKKIFFVTAALLMSTSIMAQESKCFIEDFSINPGEKKIVTLNLSNPDNQYCAFQFDLQLPAGVSVAAVNDTNSANVSIAAGRREKDHGIRFMKIDDATYRFVAFSIGNNNFRGNEGPLVNICLEASSDAVGGESVGYITKAKFTPKKGQSTTFDQVPFKVKLSDPAGVNVVVADSEGDGSAYNVAGQKVGNNFKGIVIQNGKKVVK